MSIHNIIPGIGGRVYVVSFIFLLMMMQVSTENKSNEEEATTKKKEDKQKFYITLFVIFLCTLFAIMVTIGICIQCMMKKGKELIAMQTENMNSMGNFAKVVSVEKSPANETLNDQMDLPVVKLKYQPSDSDPTVEYKLKADKVWEFPRKNLKFEQIINEGAYGAVVKAEAYGIMEKNTTTTVAIKMLKAQHSDTDMINLVIEMEVMKMVGKHMNILNLLGCCTQGGPLFVIMEYVARGNLREFLRQYRSDTGNLTGPVVNSRNTDTLSERTLLSFAHQITVGMEHLASKKYVHRDLAARNVLVSEDFVMKISDFGLARDIGNSDYYRKTTAGTLPLKWMAPECLSRGVYTTQSDVWSFGVLLWEIMTLGDPPYPTTPNDGNLFALLYGGYRMEKPPKCSTEIYTVMLDCWNYQPNHRPKFQDLAKSLFQILLRTADQGIVIGPPPMEVRGHSLPIVAQLDTPPNSKETAV